MTIIDTHCHLDFDQFDPDREDVLQRASESGVEAAVLVGIDEDHWQSTRSLAASHDFMVRAVGFHPTSLGPEWSADRVAGLESELREPDIVALGEIGLDYHHDASNRDIQREAFQVQLELAQQSGLPIVIHQRAAEQEVLDVLSDYAPLRGVMHCFGGDVAFANRCLELGLYLGIGGIVTFKKADDVRAAVAHAPLDRLLLETDAPFLAPQRWRGRRNEPAYLTEVTEQIASEKNLTSEIVTEATTHNAYDLFGTRLSDAVRVGTGLRS